MTVDTFASTENILVGLSSQLFKGHVDDFRFYARTLTQSEIDAVYVAPSGGDRAVRKIL